MRYSFGLGESSLDHRRREEFPAIFTIMVTLLFHDQKNEIAANVKKLEDSIMKSGYQT